MSETASFQQHPDNGIDLRKIVALVWAEKWLIILVTAVFAVGSVAYALSKPDIYQASALLAPAQDQGGGGPSISGQLSGLASLAGVSLGGSDAGQITIAKEVLQSRIFLSGFIRRHKIEPELMATEAWNEAKGEWIYNKDIYDPETGEWGTWEDGRSRKPTDWDLVNKLRELVRLSTDQDSSLLTLSIKSQSPVAAKQWVEWLVRDINEHMRNQDVQEAEARIDYLEGKLRETNIAGMQQVFYQLIENETRTVMLANAQQEYIFKTIDPAIVPQVKSEPKRAVICVGGTLLGGMLITLFVILRSFLRPDETPVSRKEGVTNAP